MYVNVPAGENQGGIQGGIQPVTQSLSDSAPLEIESEDEEPLIQRKRERFPSTPTPYMPSKVRRR